MSDASEIISWVGGASGIGAGVFALVKWLGSRVVEREDEDRKSLQNEVKRTREENIALREMLIKMEGQLTRMNEAVARIEIQNNEQRRAWETELQRVRTEFKEDLSQLEQKIKADFRDNNTGVKRK